MKKIALAIGICLLLVTGLSAPSSAAETEISVGLSASTVRVGTTVYVQGTVTPPTATPRVVVQRAVDHKWADRASGAVNPSTGEYRIAITPSQTGTYKLRVRSNGGSVWSETVYLAVTAPPSISAQLSRTSVTIGTTVSVSGKVTPANATPRVVVQRAVDGKWADRGSAAVSSSTGAYSLSITPSQAGTYKLRVRSNGGSVWSPTIYLTVTAKSGGGGGGSCNPNYTPCVPNATDVDCAGGSGNGPAYVQGPVRVIGTDVYGLDSDHDGIGCE